MIHTQFRINAQTIRDTTLMLTELTKRNVRNSNYTLKLHTTRLLRHVIPRRLAVDAINALQYDSNT